VHERTLREIAEENSLIPDLLPAPPGIRIVGFIRGMLVEIPQRGKIRFRLDKMFERGLCI
jgi:hypothetical protein